MKSILRLSSPAEGIRRGAIGMDMRHHSVGQAFLEGKYEDLCPTSVENLNLRIWRLFAVARRASLSGKTSNVVRLGESIVGCNGLDTHPIIGMN